MALNDVEMIVVKTPNEDGDGNGQIKEAETIRTSLIRHMCNKCNETFPTKIGLKRHLSFCDDNITDFSLQTANDGNENPSQNRNNLSSQNYNISIECDIKSSVDEISNCSKWITENKNPYEFNDEDDIEGLHANTSNRVLHNEKVCECCGENVATAHRAGYLKCKVCGRRFKYKESINLHMKRFHSDLQTAVKCPLCPIKCENQAAYSDHMNQHYKNVFICSVCNQHFTRKYHLVRHLEQTGCDGRKKAQFPCNACGRSYPRKDYLREHLRQHINRTYKKEYICEHCNKKFKGRTSLINHLKIHTGKPLFTCLHCHKSMRSKSSLVKHIRTHTGEKPYSCHECGKCFAAREVLNRHVKTHLKIKPIACNECGETFIQASQLRTHMFHHNNKCGLKCEQCNRFFSNKSNLRKHQKIEHEGVERIKCSFDGCTKTFLTRSSFKIHEKTHSDIRPFPCDTCGKRFRSKYNRIIHERIHKRETPRSCAHCSRAFIRFDCFLRHMRKKHPEDFKALVMYTRKNKLESMKQQLKYHRENTNKNKPLLSKLNGSMMDNIESDEMCFSFENMNYQEFSDSLLVSNLAELISLLVDKECLNEFNWPYISVDEVLEKVIKTCGGQPFVDEVDRYVRLRENTKLLFTVVIDDVAMKKLVETHTIDKVVLHVLELGRTV